MRRICFLGVAASPLEKEQLEAEIPEDAEIWVVNEAHRGLRDRKPDRVFQLHVRHWRESERRYLNDGITAGDWFADTVIAPNLPEGLDPGCFGRNNEHVEYLRTCGVPVYGQRVWGDIPTSVQYPFEEVTEAVGIPLPPAGKRRLWATSSFGYMAALAIHEHQSWIRDLKGELLDTRISELILLGIELPQGSQRERIWEWPDFAYYLGLATGLGIKITLPSCGTSLLSAPHYALDGHPYPTEPDHWWAPGYAAVQYDEADGTYHLGAVEVQ